MVHTTQNNPIPIPMTNDELRLQIWDEKKIDEQALFKILTQTRLYKLIDQVKLFKRSDHA